MPTIELTWNPKQSQFILSRSKRLNLEGGVRAGKSWALCYKVWEWCRLYPGIRIALTRWSQDTLDSQIKPEWRAMAERLGTPLIWHGDEEYDELPNGSIVYLRALHASDNSKRYSKLAGLTLAVIAIDQAEEVEDDVYKHYVPARLSQPGFPHAVWITPNPPMPDHWIGRRWPESITNGVYELIHTTAYDNRVNLGEEYIRDLEDEYPPDSLEYRRLILGKRGLVVSGQPIYAKHFREREHVGLAAAVELEPYTPLYEAWDFGTLRPCVVWGHFPIGGRLHLLGGIMGDDIPLEAFVPIVEEYRRTWFRTLTSSMLQWCCDPAGQIPNSHGSRTAVSILQDFGIYPVIRENANDPRVRAGAIQTTIGYLKRRAHDGSTLFRLNPRFVIVAEDGRHEVQVLQQVLEGGYSYDAKKTYSGVQYHGIRPPRKDGYYEHPANCVEYLITAFAPPDPASAAGHLRNPSAIRVARHDLEQITAADEETGQSRSLTPSEIAEVLQVSDRRRLLEARADRERRRMERHAQRVYQRDTEEIAHQRTLRARHGFGASWQRGGYR